MHRVEPETHRVSVRVGDHDVEATLTLTRTDDWGGRGAHLAVTCELGEWSGLGSDIFSAVRALMDELERVEGRIGVVGAKPNAWASGMQRDMGDGRSVYILTLPRTPGRPPSAPTLDPASLDEVGTTADQDAFQRRWMPTSKEQ